MCIQASSFARLPVTSGLPGMATTAWHHVPHLVINEQERQMVPFVQVAAGVSLWDSSARRRCVQPLLLWKLTGKSAVNRPYKLEVKILEISM